jgi:hypothetical protein
MARRRLLYPTAKVIWCRQVRRSQTYKDLRNVCRLLRAGYVTPISWTRETHRHYAAPLRQMQMGPSWLADRANHRPTGLRSTMMPSLPCPPTTKTWTTTASLGLKPLLVVISVILPRSSPLTARITLLVFHPQHSHHLRKISRLSHQPPSISHPDAAVVLRL